MKITHLKPDDYKSMPWKNGKGVTTELAIFPKDSSLKDNNFSWRISTAPVTEDGAFSLFSDCERYITLVDGLEMKLHINGQSEVINPDKVFKFSGNLNVSCTLEKGPVRDLNLITRNKTAASAFQILTNLAQTIKIKSGMNLFYVCAGQAEINMRNKNSIRLQQNETLLLLLENSEALEVEVVLLSASRCAFIQI